MLLHMCRTVRYQTLLEAVSVGVLIDEFCCKGSGVFKGNDGETSIAGVE